MTPKLHILNNGIRISTDFLSTVETVSLKFLVNTGSSNEVNFVSGISHLIEHMCFKGTKSRTAKEIARAFESIGGWVNAYTSKEVTVYYVKVIKENLELAVELMTDILQNSVFEDRELESEKKVILQEIKAGEDDNSDLALEKMQECAFAGYQIGRPILGTAESVMGTTRREIIQYIQKRYTNERLIIGISGNFDEVFIVKLLEKYWDIGKKEDSFYRDSTDSTNSTDFDEKLDVGVLDTIPNKVSNLSSVPVEESDSSSCSNDQYSGGKLMIHKSDAEQVHCYVSFLGVSYHHPDYYIYQVASTILGVGMASRLFQEVREKKGLAYDVSSFTLPYRALGLWGFYIASDQNKILEAVKISMNEVHKMSQDVQSEELQRAKIQLKASLVMSKESINSRAEKMVANYAIFQRFIPFEEILEKIERISITDITNIVSKIIEVSRIKTPTVGAAGNLEKIAHLDLKALIALDS